MNDPRVPDVNVRVAALWDDPGDAMSRNLALDLLDEREAHALTRSRLAELLLDGSLTERVTAVARCQDRLAEVERISEERRQWIEAHQWCSWVESREPHCPDCGMFESHEVDDPGEGWNEGHDRDCELLALLAQPEPH